MKKSVSLTIVFAAITASLFAQIPSNWETNKPRDTAEQKYMVGISQPGNTEQEAIKNATALLEQIDLFVKKTVQKRRFIRASYKRTKRENNLQFGKIL